MALAKVTNCVTVLRIPANATGITCCGWEIFYTLREAQILIERWRKHYNTVRPHSALGYRLPAPESVEPVDRRPTMH